MKISDLDNQFWRLIGSICHFDLDVEAVEYNSSTATFTLIAPGERLILPIDELNRIINDQKNQEYIKAHWKTGNNFNWNIEKEETK